MKKNQIKILIADDEPDIIELLKFNLENEGYRVFCAKNGKECLKLAGIENNNFSGHSLRSGFATVAAEAGADERSIMAMTGHKTTQMVRRYIKEANIFKNNALNKVKI